MCISQPANMTIGVTGSSGLIGSALVRRLTDDGHRVVPIRRNPTTEFGFSLDSGPVQDGLDVLVHLAGEPIASQRWNAAKMSRIRNSRVEGTRSLAQAVLAMKRPPRAFVCASAIGYYGDRGAAIVDETSPPGSGFLADVAQAWEHEAETVARHGIRVACLRFGMILSRRGGALAAMLPPFRMGLGGRIGTGRQFWSWIALHDALDIIDRIVVDETLAGPFNVVAPNAVTNSEFTTALGRALHRPTLFPVPAWVVRTVFGQMGQELLLASTRLAPRRLIDAGFRFRFPEIDRALDAVLND